MQFDGAGALLVRLCFALPLAYIGLSLAARPASVARSVRMLGHVLESFKNRLRGWQGADAISHALDDDRPEAHLPVRLFGVALIVFSLVPFAIR